MIDFEIAYSLFDLARRNQYYLRVHMQCGPYLESNRNAIVKGFLKSDCEWLFFWDTDLVFDGNDFFSKLIETSRKLNAPVVGIPYRMKNDSGQYVACRNEDGALKNYVIGELKEPMLVENTGNGSMLIHRSVFLDKDLEKPYFQTIQSEDGGEWPEDWRFCNNVKKIGYQIAIDPRIKSSHYAPKAWVHEYEKT